MKRVLTYFLVVGLGLLQQIEAGDLHTSAKSSEYEAVDAFVKQKVDLNELDSDGLSALHYAVSAGDTAMVRTLILGGAKVIPEAMIAIAYQNRDNPTMNLLLNAKVDPDIELEGSGKRLFDVALEEQSLETVRILLVAGAEVGDRFWKTLSSGNTAMAQVFLQNGTDPRGKGPDGNNVLEYVLQKEWHHMVLPVLKAHSSEPSREPWLSRAIRNGNESISLALLKDGAPLFNGRAADYHTYLGWAIANDMDEVAMHLIEAGVDVNLAERSPAMPHFIEKFEESKTFQSILKKDRGIRPLMMVPVKRNYKIAQALVDAGAHNKPSAKYNYPISIASWYSDVRMMQILFGRDPDDQPRKLVIDLSTQKVTLFEKDKVTYSSICSTGKKGYRTRTGTFVVTQKRKHHVSNIYGSSMPNFMRLSCSDFGLHTGVCPGYPASHGCIRLPSSAAKHYYKVCSLGDIVVIQE